MSFFRHVLPCLVFLLTPPAFAQAEDAKPAAAPVQLAAIPDRPIQKDVPVNLTLRLTDAKTGMPFGEEQLREVNFFKIQVLLLDPAFRDFQVTWPETTGFPGEYAARFVPQGEGPYLVWADVTLEKTGKHYFLSSIAGDAKGFRTDVDKKPSLSAEAGGMVFTLQFDGVPQASAPAKGTLIIKTKEGAGVNDLEPLTDGFATLMAFDAKGETIAQAGLTDAKPDSDSARGGPNIGFQLTFERSGFHRVFAIVQHEGQRITVPFGVRVP